MLSFSVALLLLLGVLSAERSIMGTSSIRPNNPMISPSYEGQTTTDKVQALWEKAIAAKGGRERLNAVRNMAVSADASYKTQQGRINQVHREYLYVFPNKYWFYEDYGSDVFGTLMRMLDYDKRMKYSRASGDSGTQLKPIQEKERNKGLDNAVIALLLETNWLRPVLVNATTGLVGTRQVDIVQTRIDGRRVDYALDQKSHLPLSVSFYDIINGKSYVGVQFLSDYVELSGIKLPRKIELGDGTVERSSIQLNVRYDPSIFLKPPDTRGGPLAWRQKS